MTPLLHDRNAVAYGAGGAIDGSVAGAAVVAVLDERRDEGSTSA